MKRSARERRTHHHWEVRSPHEAWPGCRPPGGGRSWLRSRPARAGDHRRTTVHHRRMTDRQPSRGGRPHHPGLPADPDPGTGDGGSSWPPWWACWCWWASSLRWPARPPPSRPRRRRPRAWPRRQCGFPPADHHHAADHPPTDDGAADHHARTHPPTHPPTTAAPATHPPATKPTTTKPPARNCDPAYPDACLHDGIGDYDCAGGSGNGPNYVEGPIRVLPPDPFGLDSDHDGIGCER